MASNGSLWTSGAVVAVLAVAGGTYMYTHQTGMTDATLPRVLLASASPTYSDVPLLTPPGVTFQTSSRRYMAAGAPTMYANANGMTLYTYDKDVEANKSVCVGECIKERLPVLVPANAQPVGDWSVATRDDGTKQWAHKGRPVYTYTKDEMIGKDRAKSESVNFVDYHGQASGASEDWHTLVFDPSAGITLPDGLFVRAVADAFGQGLVDEKNMTIYALDGDVKRDSGKCGKELCSAVWTPYAAAHVAHDVGEFTVITRPDGNRQWAFKGKALYTYSRDLAVGDARGDGVDGRRVALVTREYMPPGVGVLHAPGLGSVVVTTDGKTLYRRDGYRYQVGGHDFRDGSRGIPAVGRTVGTGGCDAECLKTWHPLKAPADAQPSGYWEIVTRDGGTRQWTNWGYALYTFDGDRKPGDATANGVYDVGINYDGDTVDAIPVFDITVDDGEHTPDKKSSPLAFYWHVVWP